MTSRNTDNSGRRVHGSERRIRWDGVVAILLGILVNELTLEWILVPDGEIGSPWLRLGVAGFQILAIGAGMFVLIRRPSVRLPWKRGGLAVLGAAVAWFGCFAFLDVVAPGLAAGVPGLDYFAYRARFSPDSTLVMVPRETDRSVHSELSGDLAAPEDGLAELEIPYRASYNEWGFRTNTSSPPYDAVLLGDSFVSFGETDSTTVSEMLRRASGLSTFNLGRGWYGPHQYVELLRRHGLDLEPRFALLFFFEGNDPEDVVSYLDWEAGGSYQGFSMIEGNIFERFVHMNYELLSELQASIGGLVSGGAEPGDARGFGGRQTLQVTLDGRPSPMRFAYWPDPAESPEHLLRGTAWREIRSVLTEFRDLAAAGGITPVIVSIPTKFSVYGPFVADSSDGSGAAPAGRDSTSVRTRALREITRDLDLPYLDLTSVFRRHAARGALLYYRQDSHWSPEGRRVAADTIADFLQRRWRPKTATPMRNIGRDSTAVLHRTQ